MSRFPSAVAEETGLSLSSITNIVNYLMGGASSGDGGGRN